MKKKLKENKVFLKSEVSKAPKKKKSFYGNTVLEWIKT